MKQRLIRQRRRFALVFVFLFAALTAHYFLGQFFTALPWQGALALALGIAAIGAGAITAFFTLLVPFARSMIELLLATYTPIIALQLLAPEAYAMLYQSSIAFAVISAQLIVTYMVLIGSALDRWTRMDMRVRTTQFFSPCEVERPWRVILPAPGHERCYFQPGIHCLREEDSEDNTWVVAYPSRFGESVRLQRITLESVVPGAFFRYRFGPMQRGQAKQGNTGWISLALRTGKDGFVSITIEEQRLNMPFSARLAYWLDDAFVDRIACMRAKIEDTPDWSMIALDQPRAAYGLGLHATHS